jgi:hypothetical protein
MSDVGNVAGPVVGVVLYELAGWMSFLVLGAFSGAAGGHADQPGGPLAPFIPDRDSPAAADRPAATVAGSSSCKTTSKRSQG